MKKIIISLLIFIPLQIVSGQDKIITIEHDTIHCRIISVSPIHIQYEQKTENGNTTGIYIPAEQVLVYLRSPQPAEINPYDQTDRQKPKPINKHYVGFNFSPMMTRTVDAFGNATWDQDFYGVGFEYANRKDDGEIGVGLNFSKMYVFVPITFKKYLGKYFFIGLGLMPGYELGETLCLGASAMTGVKYATENGFSISLTPSFQYSFLNLTGNKGTTNSQGFIIRDPGVEILQHAVISIGIGYRF